MGFLGEAGGQGGGAAGTLGARVGVEVGGMAGGGALAEDGENVLYVCVCLVSSGKACGEGERTIFLGSRGEAAHACPARDCRGSEGEA
jgi:hypothetical protein